MYTRHLLPTRAASISSFSGDTMMADPGPAYDENAENTPPAYFHSMEVPGHNMRPQGPSVRRPFGEIDPTTLPEYQKNYDTYEEMMTDYEKAKRLGKASDSGLKSVVRKVGSHIVGIFRKGEKGTPRSARKLKFMTKTTPTPLPPSTSEPTLKQHTPPHQYSTEFSTPAPKAPRENSGAESIIRRFNKASFFGSPLTTRSQSKKEKDRINGSLVGPVQLIRSDSSVADMELRKKRKLNGL